MEVKVGAHNQYESKIREKRKWFICFAVLALAVPSLTSLACYFGGFSSAWIGRSGAVMAFLSYLAEMSAREMQSVLVPQGMIDLSFYEVRDKYSLEIKIYVYGAIVLVLLGALIWGFGDLLPIGGA
ncbi:hypothetical protein ACPTK4_15610 [Pseudomonas aeruginosa]|uniref:hypothetical protein n=1 Tax=Pseudomonas aeruginosa TaxID=287 RepID=UPI000B9A37E4|nr:hypothetical protein [Pseudomonas aeruginosa]HEJ5942446.1 hypothetical protein [Pseudomonas aeruginosa]